jgi:hypothetical protein
MGHIKEITIEIEDMIVSGYTDEDIEKCLGCPIMWVQKCREDLENEISGDGSELETF